MNPRAEPFERNFIWTFWASSDVHQKFFSNNCVDMDSIPWEKAWLTVREKPLTLWKKQSTWISCHPDGDLKNIALRAGLRDEKDVKDYFFFWGSMRPFFIEGFSCFGTKQICMDGEQMGELALIIWDPYMEMKKGKSRFLIWLFLKSKPYTSWKRK